jgi:hypothetical protein
MPADAGVDAVYVTGGRQRHRAGERDEWHAFEEAVVLRVDLATHEVTTVFRHTARPEACPDELPSFVFKCGSIIGNQLVVCSETEILALDLDGGHVSNYVSLPIFNDVHHVLALETGHYLVANTGLDMIVEVFGDGSTGREWSTIDEDTWTRFSRDVDYRKVPSTKPHRSHPNYVFCHDDDVWATRFEQRDAICLTGTRERIRIDSGGPHDGVAHGDAIYFTSVNGHLVEIDAATLQPRRSIDLGGVEQTDEPLGWCRGVLVDDRTAWVGFSRLRPTRLRRNVSWVKHGFRHTGWHRQRPTRLAAYSLDGARLLDEIDLEPHGLNAVFSILRA